MIDRIASLQLFVRVARTGNISEAARELGWPQASASRALAALERDIGAQLLTRSTRAVVLTEAGADYLARIEPVLEAIEEANRAARGTDELRGVLRVALPTSFALRLVIPALPEFLRRHPALRVNLQMEDKRQDLLRDGVDVAIRMGPMPDSTATARLLGHNRRLLAAAPAYLAQAGTPAAPHELAHHHIVAGPAGVSASGWTFTRDGVTQTVRVDARVAMSSNDGAVAAAVAGLGIVSTGEMGSRAELASGVLVAVLADWQMDSTDIHVVYPAGRAAKLAARVFADHIIGAWATLHA
jgi:DNA-binding transcriptional LysR family regulator